MEPKEIYNALGAPRHRRWQAKWIWEAGDGKRPNTYCLFRGSFETSSDLSGVTLFITADTRYLLYVNGRYVADGPPQSQPYYQYYDEHALDPYLQEGKNTLAVLVYHAGNVPDTRGGLLLEITDSTGTCLCATDSSWQVQRSEAWRSDTYAFKMNIGAPYQEHFSSARLPADWCEPGFDDSTWQSATVLKGRHSDRPPTVPPWVFLVARDIPPMYTEAMLPVRVVQVEEATDVMNRSRSDDLSIALSLPGQPVQRTVAVGIENLCRGDGPARLQCSTLHRNGEYGARHDPCFVLDFGRVLTAHARIEVDGIPGATLDIGYAERLIDGHFNNAIEGQFADRVVLRGGSQVYQPVHWRAFRYLKIRLRNCEKPLELKSVQAVITTYPFQEAGTFSSSDETLNQVFDICRHTLRLCSNEFLMDTPWREQAQWLGDVAGVTLGGLHACFGDTALTGKFLRQSGANQYPTGLLSNISNTVSHSWQSVIPDYSLWWVIGLWSHYLYSGDMVLLREMYPVAHRILQAHFRYVNDDGFIEDMPYWVFVDWANVDRRGICTAYNALFAGALQAFSSIALRCGDNVAADRAEGVLDRLRERFEATLFDPVRGCFRDARIDDHLSENVSEHANVSALRWGLCAPKTAAGIVAQFYEGDTRMYDTEAQPFFSAVSLQALDRVGRFDLALNLIRERWGKRMVDAGLTSTTEEWTEFGTWRNGDFLPILRTLSHAWSAFPAEFLTRYLIGLKIVEPGCTAVALAPRSVDFDFSVTYPTPRGPIRVERRGKMVETSVPQGVRVVQ
ncbi:MAG: hypothetical protein OHK0029_24400 [Armatimonadaceae bacterium]